jgi:hypothetical protein
MLAVYGHRQESVWLTEVGVKWLSPSRSELTVVFQVVKRVKIPVSVISLKITGVPKNDCVPEKL